VAAGNVAKAFRDAQWLLGVSSANGETALIDGSCSVLLCNDAWYDLRSLILLGFPILNVLSDLTNEFVLLLHVALVVVLALVESTWLGLVEETCTVLARLVEEYGRVTSLLFWWVEVPHFHVLQSLFGLADSSIAKERCL
jgi:hypothetical protein